MSHTRPTAFLLAALVALLGVASEGRCGTNHADDAAALYARLGTPGTQHARIADMAGDWTYTITMWMDPNAPATKATGTAQKTMVLGGRFLREEVRGASEGGTFEGLGYTGFDNGTSQLVSTWMDNHGTNITRSTGLTDPTGKVQTFRSEQVDPTTGKMQVGRMITRIRDANHHEFEYLVTSDGEKERLVMALEYTRASAVAGQ